MAIQKYNNYSAIIWLFCIRIPTISDMIVFIMSRYKYILYTHILEVDWLISFAD